VNHYTSGLSQAHSHYAIGASKSACPLPRLPVLMSGRKRCHPAWPAPLIITLKKLDGATSAVEPNGHVEALYC